MFIILKFNAFKRIRNRSPGHIHGPHLIVKYHFDIRRIQNFRWIFHGRYNICAEFFFCNNGIRHCRINEIRIQQRLISIKLHIKIRLDRLRYFLQPVGASPVFGLPKGHTVGYGAATTLKRDTRSAVIPIGYYHGFTLQRGRDVWRAQDCIRGILSNLKLLLKPSAPTVAVGGRSTRTLGHIGMLHTCVDVTDLTCELGDLVRVEINPLLMKGLPVVYR